jgi:hypothetical protein
VDKERNRGREKGIGRVCFVAAFVGIAWLSLPFRVANPELNQIVTLFSLWFVLICLCLACACLPNRKWIRIIGSIPFAICAVLLPLALVITMVGGGPITGYEILDSLELPHSTIIAYRTNGGATTDYGIRIVQEMSVFPGLVFAKNLHDGYHEHTATLKALQPDSVQAIINEKPIEFYIRPYVYF